MEVRNMRFFPVRSLSLPIATVTFLACGTLSLGQTSVTPCPTPGPTLSKTRPVNREDNKANKASAAERPVRIEFFGLNAIPYCDALSELRSASEPVDISK